MAFEYGISKFRQEQFGNWQAIEVERVILDKSWKFKVGQYPSFETMLNSGKDIAILVLKNDVKLNNPNKPFPKLKTFEEIQNTSENLEVISYGYPAYFRKHRPKDIQKTTILRKTNVQRIVEHDTAQLSWFDSDGYCFSGLYCIFVCVGKFINVNIVFACMCFAAHFCIEKHRM